MTEQIKTITDVVRGAKRAATITAGTYDDKDQSFDFSFISPASGLNYWPGIGVVHELLDISPDTVDLTWVQSGNAPILMEHDVNRQIGNITTGQIIERNGSYAGVGRGRISPNDPHTVALYKDIITGIRTNISAGYDILAYQPMGVDDAGYPIMKATLIKINEVSIVALPFDEGVGTNRSKIDETPKVENEKETEQVKTKMAVENEVKEIVSEPKVDVEAIRSKAINDTHDRDASIAEYASAFEVSPKLTAQFIADRSKSLADFREAVKAEFATRSKQPVDAGKIGMSEKDVKAFSVSRALMAHKSGNWSGAELEKEAIDAAQKKTGRSATHGGFFLPVEVSAKRAMTKANTGLVQTTVDGSGILDYLFNSNVIAQLVGRQPTGLVGDVQYPRVTGKAAVSYIDPETGTASESNPTFDSVLIKPKYAVAKSIIPQTLLRQSAFALDSFIESHIGLALSDSLDYQCINGTGLTGHPTGILAATGVTNVDSNATALTYKDVVKMITAIKKNNASGEIVILTNSDIEGYLATTPISSTLASTMILNPGADGVGRVYGKRTFSTENVPANTLIAGDFTDAILGYWSSIEIKLDDITGADSGAMVVRGYLAYDFALGRPSAFSKITDAVIA